MSTRGRLRAVAVVLFAAASISACDDGGPGSITARGVTAPSVSASALVVPSTLPFQVMPVTGCPFAQPFGAAFSLLIDGGGSPLIFNDAAFQFLDTRGFASTVVFTRSDLTLLFGSTLIAPGASRSFPFQPQFGCGFVGTPHLMSARIGLVDEQGSVHVRKVSAAMGTF